MGCVFQYFGKLLRALRKCAYRLQPQLVDILLLHLGANDFRVRRKRQLASRVLGMKMCVDNVELSSFVDFFDLTKPTLTTSQSHAGIDHQGRATADHDADVRYATACFVRNYINVRRDLD